MSVKLIEKPPRITGIVFWLVGGVFLLVILTSAPAWFNLSHRRIKNELASGQFDDLKAFIVEKEKTPDARDDLRFAIDQSLASGAQPMLTFLEDTALTSPLPDPLSTYILQEFAHYHRVLPDSSRALDTFLLLDHNAGDSANEALYQALANDIRRFPLDVRILYMRSHLQSFSLYGWRDSTAWESAIGWNDRVTDHFNDVIPEDKDQTEAIEHEAVTIRDLASQYDELQAKLKSDQDDYDEQSAPRPQPFLLTGFIVAQRGDLPIYEIIPDSGPPRALLFCFNTQFQSRGRFALRVTRGGEIPVQLKEEFGDFTQSWPVFSEVTSEEDEEAADLPGELQQKAQNIAKEKADVAVLLSQISAAIAKFDANTNQPCTSEPGCNSSALGRADAATVQELENNLGAKTQEITGTVFTVGNNDHQCGVGQLCWWTVTVEENTDKGVGDGTEWNLMTKATEAPALKPGTCVHATVLVSGSGEHFMNQIEIDARLPRLLDYQTVSCSEQ